MVSKMVRRQVVVVAHRPEPDAKSAMAAKLGPPWVRHTVVRAGGVANYYITYNERSGQPVSEAEWNARWPR